MSERFLKYETEDVKNGNLSGVNSNGVLKSAGGGSSVQTDWNQNDETQPDYIKNRPFGTLYGKEVINEYSLTSTGQDSEGNYTFHKEISDTRVFEDLVGPVDIDFDGGLYKNIQLDISEGNLSRHYTFQTDGLPFSLDIWWYQEHPSELNIKYSGNDYIGTIQIYDKGKPFDKLLDSKYLDIKYLSEYCFPLCTTKSYPMEGGESIVYNSERKRYEPSYNVILKSSTSGSNKKFKLTVDDAGTLSATEVTT